MAILNLKVPQAPGILLSAFRDWASTRVGLSPRDAVMILHFACRRLRMKNGAPIQAATATALIEAVAAMVLTDSGTEEEGGSR